jgi:hypothetical protein
VSGVSFIPPWRFYPRSRLGLYYWRPRRITLREPGRPAIYRWAWFNFMMARQQKGDSNG